MTRRINSRVHSGLFLHSEELIVLVASHRREFARRARSSFAPAVPKNPNGISTHPCIFEYTPPLLDLMPCGSDDSQGFQIVL